MTFTATKPDRPTTVKDPDAVLDYTWDFQDVLDAGDTIVSCVFTPDPASGLTVTQQSNTTTACTAWLSGGIIGSTWGVTCEYTTAAGRKDDRTLYFTVKQR